MNKQKIETELQKIESSVNVIRSEIKSGITFGEMKRSEINGGVMLANGSGDVIPMPYSALEFRDDGKIIMKYLWINPDKIHYLSCLSNTGQPGDWYGSSTTAMIGGASYGAYTCEMFKGYYYHSHHIYPVVNGKCQTKFFRSTNGTTWIDITNISTPIFAGEDRSFMVLNKGKEDEKLLMFIRPYLPNSGDMLRHIDLWETTDGLNWIFVKRLMTATNVYNQYYSISACQIADDIFYTCMNEYDSADDVLQMRFYSTKDIYDFSKYVHLDSILFPRDIKMMFGAVSYDKENKQVVLLAGESKGEHNEPSAPDKRIRICKYTSKVV